MTHSTLYWHCATHTSTVSGDYRPPHEHQLIACAGIEVTGEADEDGLGLSANVWTIMSPEPVKPLARTLASAYRLDNLVTFYGNNFGLPVLWSTALRHSVPMIGFDNLVHTDLAKEVSGLVAPSNRLTFDSVLDLLELPIRPDLDVVAAWESDDPQKQKRILMRLVVDCCFIALADIRLQLVRGEIGPEYAENFTRAVLEAANQKVPKVNKIFATFLEDEQEPEAEEPEADDSEEDDLEDGQEPNDVLDDFDDFGDLGDTAEQHDGDF